MSTPALPGDLVRDSDDATDLLMWITLSRVAEDGVTQQGDHYLAGSAPLAPYLVAPVTTLLADGAARSPRDAIVLDDPGADPGVAGACDVRLPASGVEPVAGPTSPSRVARLSDHDPDPAHPRQQCGRTLPPESTSLPVRVPGTHLHPLLRRPPSWAGPSGRAGAQA